MGPLGNGFTHEDSEDVKVLIVGGGIGIPPLLQLAKECKQSTVNVVLGFKDEVFLVEDFMNYSSVEIATEDGSSGIKGNVMNIIRTSRDGKPDVIYGCGPVPMLRAIKEYAEKYSIPFYLSVEEKMACGIGACLACVCKGKNKDSQGNFEQKRICVDGPVFLSSEVEI
jgi:dihydroorotate dehydrogenase electron transfer subunit